MRVVNAAIAAIFEEMPISSTFNPLTCFESAPIVMPFARSESSAWIFEPTA
jgi:hypothetical protein